MSRFPVYLFRRYYWYQKTLRLKATYQFWKASRNWFDYSALYQYMFIYADTFIKGEKICNDENRKSIYRFRSALERLVKDDYNDTKFSQILESVEYKFVPTDTPEFQQLITVFKSKKDEKLYKKYIKQNKEDKKRTEDIKLVATLFKNNVRTWWD